MRLYRVSRFRSIGITDQVVFEGTSTDATHKRMEWMKEHHIRRADVEVEELDVPTDKAGLIAFLNGLVAP